MTFDAWDVEENDAQEKRLLKRDAAEIAREEHKRNSNKPETYTRVATPPEVSAYIAYHATPKNRVYVRPIGGGQLEFTIEDTREQRLPSTLNPVDFEQCAFCEEWFHDDDLLETLRHIDGQICSDCHGSASEGYESGSAVR